MKHTKDQEKCAGYISLIFFDDTTGEAVTIGGAGFVTAAALKDAWGNIQEFPGQSSFQADLQDDQHDIIDERTISAETCEILTGKPIAELVIEGRQRLQDEIDSYRQAAAVTAVAAA